MNKIEIDLHTARDICVLIRQISEEKDTCLELLNNIEKQIKEVKKLLEEAKLV